MVHKPAPLPMHAGGRFHRNTLQYILNIACEPFPPRPVHRLDANTTGVVLFARTRHFCRLLQQQFIERGVDKRYLVGVAGHPDNDLFPCNAPISTEADAVGSRHIDEDAGLVSRTDFKVIERRADGSSLLEAKLSTGRTNQIRLHLQHLGYPVCGDATYLADGLTGNTQTLDPGAPPMMLHAWKISFHHPRSGEAMHFEVARPEWALAGMRVQ